MAKLSLDPLGRIDGFMAVALVDSGSGLALATLGSGIDLELAAAGNTEVVRAKRKVASALKLNDNIEDILITLGKQYHILRPAEKINGIFIYYVLDNGRANLALARRKVSDVESKFVM